MDHIPPQTMYARPLPHPRPNVPACRRCHNVQTGRDDVHFRDTVLNYFRVTGLPQAQQQLTAMLRRLEDPKQQNYRAAIARRVGKAELRTPAGLYLGQWNTYTMDVRAGAKSSPECTSAGVEQCQELSAAGRTHGRAFPQGPRGALNRELGDGGAIAGRRQ